MVIATENRTDIIKTKMLLHFLSPLITYPIDFLHNSLDLEESVANASVKLMIAETKRTVSNKRFAIHKQRIT